MNINLPWEKTIRGKHGVYKSPKKSVVTPTFLKQLAISKMVDVRLISADFNDNPAVFSPRVCLLLDFSSHVEFFGVYKLSEFTEEEDEKELLPSFCIRRSFWNKSEDIENIKIAEDKHSYLMGENQILSNVIFAKPKQIPEVKELISQVFYIVRQGLQFQDKYSNDVFYQEAKLSIFDECLQLNLSYNPYMVENHCLNEWILKWRECISNVPLDISSISDDLFRVSYQLSFFDKMKILSEAL